MDAPYQPGGWTVRPVAHHYLALTEESPTLKSYGEALWAELPDAWMGPIEPSLTLLAALHERWIEAWRALEEPDWLQTFYHPKRGPVTLEHLASLYAWHGRHDVAQVRALRTRNGSNEKSYAAWPVPQMKTSSSLFSKARRLLS